MNLSKISFTTNALEVALKAPSIATLCIHCFPIKPESNTLSSKIYGTSSSFRHISKRLVYTVQLSLSISCKKKSLAGPF